MTTQDLDALIALGRFNAGGGHHHERTAPQTARCPRLAAAWRLERALDGVRAAAEATPACVAGAYEQLLADRAEAAAELARARRAARVWARG